ncbi:MAG: hypothetical protein ACLP8S_01160 [Solirubrobacteraceae bacterium]
MSTEMPSTRRRISGMPPPAETQAQPEAAPPASPPTATTRLAALEPPSPPPAPAPSSIPRGVGETRPFDYAETRMVSLRIPVAVIERYKHLLAELEQSDSRLRRPGFTELVVQLLVEGPSTANQAGEIIRRKRAAEHAA